MIENVVLKDRYVDSVVLMSIAAKIKEIKGVDDASAIVGSDENKAILESTGFLTKEGKNAKPSDLILAIKANEKKVITQAVKKVMEFLDKGDDSGSSTSAEKKIRNLDEALGAFKDSNIIHFSIPGKYVYWEAKKCLDAGKHLFLFSDNVPIEEEIELKKIGYKKKLLVMGPDCGTAIINGVALGFANVVNNGPIGVVAAAGTGIQEVTSLIHNYGSGITQAIGTGGRDLKEKVGGLTMLLAIDALKNDKKTKVIILISKLPDKKVQTKILNKIRKIKKPFVVLFLDKSARIKKEKNIQFVQTIEQAALAGIALSENKKFEIKDFTVHEEFINMIAEREGSKYSKKQKYLRGLYSGGTLCQETNLILQPILKNIYSNAAADKRLKLKDAKKSIKHTTVDLGEDEFTVGVPHPMIDFTVRNKRLLQEASDKETAIILLDIVLGYGAHPNPYEAMKDTIIQAQKIAKQNKNHISFIASITGTDIDPQNREEQKKKFENLGVIIMPSNAQAARLGGRCLTGCPRI